MHINVNLLCLGLLKLMDELPEAATFKSLAMSSRSANRYDIIGVLCHETDDRLQRERTAHKRINAFKNRCFTEAQLVLHPHPLHMEVGWHEFQLPVCFQVASFEGGT